MYVDTSYNLVLLLQCNSRYIIGFYGAFFNENRISICTEYMDGKSCDLVTRGCAHILRSMLTQLGGSLDRYGMIPEEVLGRIAVAVS